MAVRTLDELNRDQDALLDGYLDQQSEGGSGGVASVSVPRPALQWGQVTQVVTSDATYGPHLVVQGKIYTGVPPTLTDAPIGTFRCYPAPGKVVNDYAVNDYVGLSPTAGAMIALRVG